MHWACSEVDGCEAPSPETCRYKSQPHHLWAPGTIGWHLLNWKNKSQSFREALNNSESFIYAFLKLLGDFLKAWPSTKKRQQLQFPSHWEWEERPVNLSTISHGSGSTADTLPWASSPVLLNFLYIVLKKWLRSERFPFSTFFVLKCQLVIPIGQRR